MKKLLVILLVLGLAAPAMAAEWNLYGSARIQFAWETYTDGASSATDTDGETEDDTDLNMNLQSNSRIGANVKTSDVVTGRFEYGTGVNVRLLYGVWNFGAGSFLVGQAYSPVDCLWSNMVSFQDQDLVANGAFYSGRVPQLKLTIGGFQAALVKNSATAGAQNDNDDVMLPALEVAYDMAFGIAKVGVFGMYQTQSVRSGDDDLSINSSVLGVRFEVAPGAFYVKGDIYTGTNLGDANYLSDVRSGDPVTPSDNYDNYDTTNEEDASTLGFAVCVGASFSDMIGIEAGLGYVGNSREDAEASMTTYYIQLPITLAPGVTITPEYAAEIYNDAKDTNGDDIEDNGAHSSFGAKFQINF